MFALFILSFLVVVFARPTHDLEGRSAPPTSSLFLVLTVSCGIISTAVGVGVLVRRLRKSKPFKSLSFRRTRASLALELLPTHTKSHTLLPQSPSLESLKLSPPPPSPYRPLTPNPARISSPDIQTHRRSRSLGAVRHSHSPPSLIDFSTSSSSTSSDLGTLRHSHTLALPQPLPSPPNDTWRPKERDLLVFSPPPPPDADKDAIPLIDLSTLTPPRTRQLPPSRSVSPSPIRSSPNVGIIVISPLDGSHSPPPASQEESQESVRGWERAWTHDWDHRPPSPSHSPVLLSELAPRSPAPTDPVDLEEDVSTGWDPVWVDDVEAGLESPEQDLIRFAPDEAQPEPAGLHDDLKHQPVTDAWTDALGSSPAVFTASPAPMSDISLSPPPPAIQVMSPVESDDESEGQARDSVDDEITMEKSSPSELGEQLPSVVIVECFDGMLEAGLSEAMGDILSIDDMPEPIEEMVTSGVEEAVMESSVEEAEESALVEQVESVQKPLPIQSTPEPPESVEEMQKELLSIQNTPEFVEPSTDEVQKLSLIDECAPEPIEEIITEEPEEELTQTAPVDEHYDHYDLMTEEKSVSMDVEEPEPMQVFDLMPASALQSPEPSPRIPLITISEDLVFKTNIEDPDLLPLPEFPSAQPTLNISITAALLAKGQEKSGPTSPEVPCQTPTPPASPPIFARALPAAEDPAHSPTSPRPTPDWSIRASAAPPLGLSLSVDSLSPRPRSRAASPVKLSVALPGSFPESATPAKGLATPPDTPPAARTSTPAADDAPSSTAAASGAAVTTATSTSLTRPVLRSRPRTRSPLDIALAMQLRPGLGRGADPAWMVRFLMAVFGWFAVMVAGDAAQ